MERVPKIPRMQRVSLYWVEEGKKEKKKENKAINSLFVVILLNFKGATGGSSHTPYGILLGDAVWEHTDFGVFGFRNCPFVRPSQRLEVPEGCQEK